MSDLDGDGIAVGQRVAFRKTLTVAEQTMFTGISGNLGPLYVDRVRARAAGQPDMVAFELVVAALTSTCIARLVGPAWRISSLAFDFAVAVPVGSTIEAAAEVEAHEGDRIRLMLTCGLPDGAPVMSGTAVLARV